MKVTSVHTGFIMRYSMFVFFIIFSCLAIADELASPNTQSTYKKLLDYYFTAASTGDKQVIKQFVSAGIPIDSVNHNGDTALMLAAYNGHDETVALLLNLGANACFKNKHSNTALKVAISSGEFDIAEQLLSHNCDGSNDASVSQTTEQFAQMVGQLKVLDLMNKLNKQ